MKILQLIPSLKKGGAERLCLDLSFQLQELGNEVVVIAMSKENEYHYLSSLLNCQIIPVNVLPSILKKSTVEIDILQSFVKEFSPDIIHVHLYEAVFVSSLLTHNAKLVIHFHDNMVQFERFSFNTLFSKKKITNFYERRLILNSWKKINIQFIAISDHSEKFIKRVFFDKYPSQKLLNGFNYSRFFATVNGIRNDELIMIGSLVSKKGQSLAIETLQVLVERGYNFNLYLLGDGPLMESLKTLVENKNLSNWVHLLGNVADPERYLSRSKIYIHTAIYEPLGLALLEAMAAGLPIVCTDGGGNKDLVTDGENGYLIKKRSPKLLADKIEWLINNEKDRLRMAKAGQEFALNFRIEDYAKKVLEIYTA